MQKWKRDSYSGNKKIDGITTRQVTMPGIMQSVSITKPAYQSAGFYIFIIVVISTNLQYNKVEITTIKRGYYERTEKSYLA